MDEQTKESIICGVVNVYRGKMSIEVKCLYGVG